MVQCSRMSRHISPYSHVESTRHISTYSHVESMLLCTMRVSATLVIRLHALQTRAIATPIKINVQSRVNNSRAELGALVLATPNWELWYRLHQTGCIGTGCTKLVVAVLAVPI